MAIKSRNKVNPSFSMAAMSDLVFLLLIFFVTTSTLINPNALRLLLPKSTNQTTAKSGVSVSIKHYTDTQTFSYHINGAKQPIPFANVEAAVQYALKDVDDPTISLHVDRTLPVEHVVDMMNIAKRNRYKIILATLPE
ncbi:MAG: biopolymer transporter ExbD [Prevotellaceae bacterium]|jgi:biopolymer transport protein ExbD|nr:biopolymer transporter ExbD [Prevotellaceae bacterium]